MTTTPQTPIPPALMAEIRRKYHWRPQPCAPSMPYAALMSADDPSFEFEGHVFSTQTYFAPAERSTDYRGPKRYIVAACPFGGTWGVDIHATLVDDYETAQRLAARLAAKLYTRSVVTDAYHNAKSYQLGSAKWYSGARTVLLDVTRHWEPIPQGPDRAFAWGEDLPYGPTWKEIEDHAVFCWHAAEASRLTTEIDRLTKEWQQHHNAVNAALGAQKEA